MSYSTTSFDEDVVRLLCDGGIGVLRTDTIYGVVAVAENEAAVERIYALKGRTPSKSPIVLIGSISQLFEHYDNTILQRLEGLWPGKNSVILSSKTPTWIVRSNASIAYRLPDNQRLCELLQKTGPLVAPSANPEGEATATTIKEAEAYFGDKVDFYVDGGAVTDNTPSQLYRLQPDGLERLR